MGVVFFLFLWPLVLAVGIFELVLPFIPYIILASSVFWLVVGLLIRSIFNKYQLFVKGLSHEKTWVRVCTDIFRWVVRIDIAGNIVLILGAVILAVVFGMKGITPFLFWN